MRPSLLLLLATALVLPAAASPTPTAAQSAPACPAPSAVPEQTPDAPLLMPEQSRLDLFDAVWGAINDGYLDPSFNGVDWAAIGDEYAPYFLQTENAWEVYDLVEEMVGLLRKGMNIDTSKALNDKMQAIEAEADRQILELYRDTYAKETDPMRYLILKDLFELLEKAIDRCRDAGNVVHQVVLKNS